MAAEIGISLAAAQAMLDALVDLMDAGAGAGYIEVRTGTRPDNVTDAATGTLLGTLTCSDPAFGAAADNNPGAKATASAITQDSSADNTGTASWFRAYDSDDLAIIDGNVGTSNADMILDSVNIKAGGPISITSWIINLAER